MDFWRRVKGKLAVAGGRIRYEWFPPRVGEREMRARIAEPLLGRVGSGGGFWRRTYEAFLAACPEEIRPRRESILEGKAEALDNALAGKILSLGGWLAVPEGYDWHTELVFGKAWRRKYVGALSDFNLGTDIALLWFENRMVHLLDVSYAYTVTGDERYAELWVEQVTSWCRSNRYLVGPNWRSPMEMGIRLFVWAVGLKELAGSPRLTEEALRLIFESMIFQAEHLSDHFSYWGGKANNHLIAEASLLYTFSTLAPFLAPAQAWSEQSERVLRKEVTRQVLPDGVSFEGAVCYQAFVADLLLLYCLAKALRGEVPCPEVRRALARMLEVLLKWTSPAGRLPRFGDDAARDFLVLKNLDHFEARPLPDPVVLAYFLKPEWVEVLRSHSWGRELVSMQVPLAVEALFAQGGFAVSRSKTRHLVYAGGIQHDREYHPGHMHSDLGSFELELQGQPVFIDSGTYLYTYDPVMRCHFKGTSAHNTVLIDSTSMMECDDIFKWRAVVKGRGLGLAVHEGAVVVTSAHDYPVWGAALSRRRVIILVGEEMLLVADRLVEGRGGGGFGFRRPGPRRPEVGGTSPGRDEPDRCAEFFFHTPFAAESFKVEGGRIEIRMPPPPGPWWPVSRSRRPGPGANEGGHGRPGLGADGGGQAKKLFFTAFSAAAVDVNLVSDPGDPTAWYSPCYGELKTGTTLRSTCFFRGSLLVCHLLAPADGPGPEVCCGEDAVEAVFLQAGGKWQVRFDPLLITCNGASVLEGKQR